MPIGTIWIAGPLNTGEGVAGALDPHEGECRTKDPPVLAADDAGGAPVPEPAWLPLDDGEQVVDAACAFSRLRIGLEIVRVDERAETGGVPTIHGPQECLEDGASVWWCDGVPRHSAGVVIGSTHSARHAGGSHGSA
jgi:hypothetical protein